jgi:hypothetical protein
MNICIGDITAKIISVLTFGFGKKIAARLAALMGFSDCGCTERQRKMNDWGGCKKNIKLT